MKRVILDTSALDPTFKAHALRGTGRYVQQLSQYFAESHDSENFHLRVDPLSFYEQMQRSRAYRLLQYAPVGRLTVTSQLLVPSLMRSSEADLFHFPAHIDAPSNPGAASIVTVLDLIPQLFPEHYRPERFSWRFRFARYLELRAIRAAKRVIAISECTKRDLVRLLNISPERIDVTPLGVGKEFFAHHDRLSSYARVTSSLGVPANARLLLYVGGIDWRKNISLALKVVAALKQRRTEPVYFALAGKIQSDRRYSGFIGEVQSLGVEDRVIELGYVPDNDLGELFAASDVFLFPSLYEGFGLPVLEAMAGGAPVLASKCASLPEIVNREEFLFDPNSLDEVVAKTEKFLNDKSFAEEARTWGKKRATLFSWQRTGQLTLRAYERALGGTSFGRDFSVNDSTVNDSAVHNSMDSMDRGSGERESEGVKL